MKKKQVIKELDKLFSRAVESSRADALTIAIIAVKALDEKDVVFEDEEEEDNA